MSRDEARIGQEIRDAQHVSVEHRRPAVSRRPESAPRARGRSCSGPSAARIPVRRVRRTPRTCAGPRRGSRCRADREGRAVPARSRDRPGRPAAETPLRAPARWRRGRRGASDSGGSARSLAWRNPCRCSGGILSDERGVYDVQPRGASPGAAAVSAFAYGVFRAGSRPVGHGVRIRPGNLQIWPERRAE